MNNRTAPDASADWNVPAALLELEQAGDVELLRDVISLFKEDTLSRLQYLREAASDCDSAGIRRQAHALKGSATQLGADAMATMCQQLESRILQGESLDVPLAVSELRTEFDRIWPAMAARAGQPS
jgi:HPt (histidine-containing phosphotransfer) domain-containing protein